MLSQQVVILTLTFLFIHQTVISDEIIIEKKRNRRKNVDDSRPDSVTSSPLNKEDAEILKRFFANEGIVVDTSNATFVNRYTKDIIAKMGEFLDGTKGALAKYELDAEVNSMIHEMELARAQEDDKVTGIASLDEVLLRAIDLMLPDTNSNRLYELAKKDLRKFYLENPQLASDLLERVRVALADRYLHTGGLAKYLRNFYYHWIPLGRLTKFIEITNLPTAS